MREGRISVLPKARSLFPYAPPSSSAAHGPNKKSPRVDFSLILPTFLHCPPPPTQQEVWLQLETIGFPLGLCDPLHVPAVDKSRLTSSQMLGQFSNTQGHTHRCTGLCHSQRHRCPHTHHIHTCNLCNHN